MTTIEQITLRGYRPDDLAAVREIDQEFQREVAIEVPARSRHLADLDDIEGVYLHGGGAFWIAEHPAQGIAGYGAVLRVDATTARLRRFRVRQQWRRLGLATLLLAEAERFCREQGLLRVTLGTTDQQQPAQAFYRKHGYRAFGEHWLTPTLREIEFAKELEAP